MPFRAYHTRNKTGGPAFVHNDFGVSIIVLNPSPWAVQLIDVVREYASGGQMVRAIDGIRLEIPAGQFVAVMGRSGSGKSTLLSLLAGIDTPSSGQILIGGEALHRLSDEALTRLRRDKIGMVYQFFNLLSTLSVRENVMLPALLAGVTETEIGPVADALLEEVRMAHRRDARPHTLSGGEMQRVALARALVRSPELVLADEPTGNLDSKTADQVVGMLRDLGRARRATVVLVTHNPEAAAVADRTVELSDGRIVQDVSR
ncbi:MAG: ABC transporter ATP-binding protein [candidate division Zixibacteria bacterium]|nr:ABC transporter ATP-binding protein [candidate division Zixibacteria bacterium]